MCGIAGILCPDASLAAESLEPTAVRMADALRHRGPDDAGSWCDGGAGIALAHRRLSIIDLSEHGHQPMVSADGRHVLSYNGEIYNYREIRKRLQEAGVSFSGHSDSEVLVEAIAHWGIEAALQHLVGMFAFAVWDRQEGQLCLARDRLGEKPLYYGWIGKAFVFASELKALKTCPGWQGEIEPTALVSHIRYSYIPAPHSIYQGVSKLLPGTFLTLRQDSRPGTIPSPKAYWSASAVIEQGRQNRFAGSDGQAVDALHALLKSTLQDKLVADVPLGAFLSGGIDSSLVVALMQEQCSRPVRTFTIGFAEQEFDEAKEARAVAAHLGTEHTELYVQPREAMDVIAQLPRIYCEPFADSSQIPTFLVSRLAREHVTVSLSGDGGDELFAGYNRYYWASTIYRKTGRLPAGIRHGISRLIAGIPPETVDSLFRFTSTFLPGRFRYHQAGDKLHKIARVLAADDWGDVYQQLVSQTTLAERLVPGAGFQGTMGRVDSADALHATFEEYMMHRDLLEYLPGDILTKLDRAAMAVSLESRVPLLDHRIVEFAWRLPLSVKLRGQQGKWILRQILARYLPPALIDRPKKGFGIPLGQWLRGPLRDWAEPLLSAGRLENESYLHAPTTRRLWNEHMQGKRDHSAVLWNILMFQAWLDVN